MAWNFRRKNFSVLAPLANGVDLSDLETNLEKCLKPLGSFISENDKRGRKVFRFRPKSSIVEAKFGIADAVDERQNAMVDAKGSYEVVNSIHIPIILGILGLFVFGPTPVAFLAFLTYFATATLIIKSPEMALVTALQNAAGNVLEAAAAAVPSNLTAPNPPVAPLLTGGNITKKRYSPKRVALFGGIILTAIYGASYWMISDLVTRNARAVIYWQTVGLKKDGLIKSEYEVTNVDVPFEAVLSSSYKVILHLRSYDKSDKQAIIPAMVQGNCWTSGCAVQVPGFLLMNVDQ